MDTSWNSNEPFQLTRVRNDALALMERTALFGGSSLRAPETHAAVTRSAARLARVWAWIAARQAGDSERAAYALSGAEAAAFEQRRRAVPPHALACEVDALTQRAIRLEALYRDAR